MPAHSHDHEQAGYVVHGTFTFDVEGTEHVINPGESYVIPGGATHSAENRAEGPVDGIDVFAPPRENPDWMK